MTDLVFKEESYKTIGCCFEVYNELGSGFLKAIYQEALAMEFTNRKVPFMEFPEIEVEYKGIILNKKYYPDFLCFDKIIVEIKAVELIAPEHEAVLLNYLKGTNSPLGLFVNFGGTKLQYKRFANTRK